MWTHFTPDVSLPDNILLTEEEDRFDGESQQLCEPYLCVLEERHLVDDLLVEAERDVCLEGDGHPLEQWAKTNSFVSLPDILIVAE